MANAKKIWDAIEAQNTQMLAAAISNSDDANIVHADGDRPLHKCCELGFNAGVKILLSKGADPCLPGKEECTALMICAILDNVETLAQLQLFVPQAVQPRVMQELLMLAASHNSVETARFILKSGADPDFQDPIADFRTALHWAAQQGSADVATLLLSAGANPNITDVDGFSPLHTAAAENEPIVLQQLIQAGGDLSMKCQGDNSATSLHTACIWQHIDAARVLIAAGANRFVVNGSGQSPFEIALGTRNEELIALFSE